ncbi:MAG: thioredoxin domain-containing protein [Deltaproteobacteria bacterium]|nr:thioredoxin domain-containing protein [Deltaproteobacteria bacterium]
MIRVALLLLLAAVTATPKSALARPPWESIPWWGDLERSERSRVEKLAQEKFSYGPCSNATIAACFEKGTRIGWRLARLLIYLVQRGAEDQDIGRIIDERRVSYTAQVRAIDIAGSPALGGGSAVTLVEFADFECPMCASITPTLKDVVGTLGGKVKLVFKHFPLKGHRNSVPAALAAVAAAGHGKFWEMADLLFKNMDAHEGKHLEGYAQKLGIPLEPFRAAVKDPATLKAIEKDKDLGLTLGVRATPSLFVNGREFKPMRDRFLLLDRIEEEMDRVEGKK